MQEEGQKVLMAEWPLPGSSDMQDMVLEKERNKLIFIYSWVNSVCIDAVDGCVSSTKSPNVVPLELVAFAIYHGCHLSS